MHSFSAGPASSPYITRIRPALTCFADEVRGTLARLSAYGLTLALLAILGIALCKALPDAMVAEPSTTGGWSHAERPAWAFAISRANLHDKTETYEVLRHSGGGRKDVLHWTTADHRLIAGLEIYRPGGEIDQQDLAAAELAAWMDPGGARELQAAGVIDSKFGTVTLHGLTGGGETAHTCLGFIKRIDDPPLRISGWSCQGDDLPARRAAVGCMLNRLVLLVAGRDTKLAELFAHAELRRSDCASTVAPALSADWVTGANNPRLRGAL